ncbi:Arylesterase [Pigmentiphaga humi]|uniref:Arylesterase n=1 Tax=Pigmentiphaga humi TaxID=2478468 RepID=A0A3P4B2B4_9BURK|nr:alpha/beta hydrolase [Pigmentiphaga humi]VCU70424.1 Arylesterase [Pigmentiphaga humi]
MPYANSGPVGIYYESHGEGPAVMFVHGSGGHHAAWWQQVPVFASDYRVLTIDLRGFGRSDPVEGGPDAQDFPDDLLAVLDHAGVERAVLVGQSIGAVASLQAAVRHPGRVAGVILAHSLGGMNHPDVTPLVRADRAVAETLPVIDRLLTPEFQAQRPEMTFLFKQMGTFNHATMQDLRNLSVGGPSVEQVAASGVRVAFLAGERDAVIRTDTVRKAHELLPGSLLDVVPAAPHSMYWEMPAQYNAAVGRLLRRLYA